MKVAHLNTNTYGGAAIVAKRIHSSLKKSGIDSILLTKFGKPTKDSFQFYLKKAVLRYWLRKKLSQPRLYRIAKWIQGLRPHVNLANRPDGFEVFSPLHSEPLQGISDILDDRQIIHLHGINDFIDYSNFFKFFSKKFFLWTLHDMNPITGGCHHSDGCLKFTTECKSCPQLINTIDPDYAFIIQQAKIKGLQFINDDQLVLVSPSKWLAELSRKSAITGRFRTFFIPNPAFSVSQVFNLERDLVKKKLGLPSDKKIILFASDNLNNPRKGVDVLYKAAELIKEHDEILLVGIGLPGKKPQGLKIQFTGSISDDEILASYFYCADVFVLASLAENSPLVIIESLICGTPVVATDVGGIPDLITDKNGELVPRNNTEILAQSIQSVLFFKTFDRDQIRNNALALYDADRVTHQYEILYQDLLSSNKS